MIEKINHYKYIKIKEPLEYNLSNGLEDPLVVKINLSVTEKIENHESKYFFRSKLTESISDNSIYIDFFISRELEIDDKLKKIKQYISNNPEILVKLFELNVV